MAYIEFKDVCKNYQMEKITIKALNNISFEIEKGEIVIITGPSGAGKTTLLNILGGIDNISSGDVLIDNAKLNSLKGKKLVKYRRQDVGFVFQFYDLVKNLTVKENVELSSQICKNSNNPVTILKKVGLTKQMNNYSYALSNGEKQKVAIAQAIVKKPKLLLCDEPLNNLDCKTGKQILKPLYNMSLKEKMTVVIVTHNNAITPIANKVITLKNGNITNIKINKKPATVGDLKW